MLLLAAVLIATYSLPQCLSSSHFGCDNVCMYSKNKVTDLPQLMELMCGCIVQIQFLASSLVDQQKMDTLVDPTVTTDDFRAQPFNTDMRTTTEDICDILCSVQLGGDACLCSHPSLPGK